MRVAPSGRPRTSFTPTFVAKRRVGFYGGSDAAGPLTDFWEYDIATTSGGRCPSTRLRARAQRPPRFCHGRRRQRRTSRGKRERRGGRSDVDATREAPRASASRRLQPPAVDLAMSSQLKSKRRPDQRPGISLDGTRWRFIGPSDFAGGGYRLLVTPTAPATGSCSPTATSTCILVDAFGRGTPSLRESAVGRQREMTVDFK